MPFKRKETATAIAEPAEPIAATANGAAVRRLVEQIDDFASQVSSALNESMLISPDADFLPEELLRGLKAVAAAIGYTDYDPKQAGTFYFTVTETAAKFLYGPALVQKGGKPAIRWGDRFIEISPETSLYAEPWRLVQGGDKDPSYVLFQPKGLAFPVSVRPDVSSQDEAKEFQKNLGTMDCFGDLVKWLRNGVPPKGLYTLQDGQAIEIQSVSDEMKSRTDDGNTYRIAEAIFEDESPCRFYVADDLVFKWTNLEFPCVATRKGTDLVIEQEKGNIPYSIRFPVSKMGDVLKEGETYSVVDYDEEDGKFGLQINISLRINGQVQKVRANQALRDRILHLKSQGKADFFNNPSHLIVDTIKTSSKDNKTRVSARLITQADLENPLMQRLLQQQQAAKKS